MSIRLLPIKKDLTVHLNYEILLLTKVFMLGKYEWFKNEVKWKVKKKIENSVCLLLNCFLSF